MSGGRFDVATLCIATESLSLEFHLVPWDTAIFGFAVAEIRRVEVRSDAAADGGYGRFVAWRDDERVRLVSCRLAHLQLRESMFLERHGFRFVEMVYSPVLESLEDAEFGDQGLDVAEARADELPRILAIAETAFSTGRYLLDHRLDARLSHARYASWVRDSVGQVSHQLIRASSGGEIVGFFLVETRPDGSAYWHLTAIAPAYQGRGIGRRLWRSVIMRHKRAGIRRIETTVSAHNPGVVGLYADLGFTLQHPQMTFHWLRHDGAHELG